MIKVPGRTKREKELVEKNREEREKAFVPFALQQWKQSVWNANADSLSDEQRRWETFFVAAIASSPREIDIQTALLNAHDMADSAMGIVEQREKLKWEECLARAEARRKEAR